MKSATQIRARQEEHLPEYMRLLAGHGVVDNRPQLLEELKAATDLEDRRELLDRLIFNHREIIAALKQEKLGLRDRLAVWFIDKGYVSVFRRWEENLNSARS